MFICNVLFLILLTYVSLCTGVFLQDFLIVEEVSDKLGNGTFNFQKARRVSSMISRLRRYRMLLARAYTYTNETSLYSPALLFIYREHLKHRV